MSAGDELKPINLMICAKLTHHKKGDKNVIEDEEYDHLHLGVLGYGENTQLDDVGIVGPGYYG